VERSQYRKPAVYPYRVEDLIEDEQVELWKSNGDQGSSGGAKVRLRNLSGFCSVMEILPADLVKLSRQDMRTIVMRYRDKEQSRGVMGSTIKTIMKAVASWLEFNDLRQQLHGIKVRGSQDVLTLTNEKVPEPSVLRDIVLKANIRTRVAIIFLAHSGIRPRVLGDEDGVDGLRLSDLPEVTIDNDAHEVVFESTPTRVVVRPELNKKRREYTTFLSSEGCTYLASYLRERMNKGEILHPASPVLPPTGSKNSDPNNRMKDFVTRTKVSDAIRVAVRGAGYAERPYVLKRYFAMRTQLAEGVGKIIHGYRQHFLGHKPDMTGEYTFEKGNLQKELVEQMRDQYRACEPYLSTISYADMGIEDQKLQTLKTLLLALDYTDDEIDQMHLEDISNDEIRELFSKKKEAEIQVERELTQKMVPYHEAQSYFDNGWVFVGNAGPEMLIISPPGIGQA